MKKLSLLLMIVLLSSFVFGAKTATLKDLNDPTVIAVGKDRVYVSDKATVLVYSLDGKFIKKFGQKGEGPSEFMVSPNAGGLRLDVLPDMLMATSIGKVSFFDFDGKFIRVIKAPRGVANYKPLGDGFAGLGFAREEKILYATMSLFDAKLEKIKEFYRQKSPYQPGGKMNPFLTPPMPYVDGNTFVVDTRLGTFLVYNEKAERLAAVEYKFEKTPLTDAHKEAVMHHYRTNPRVKKNFEYIKKMIEFPQNLPDVKMTNVDDGKIYAQTYRRKDDKAEFFIFDFKGKLIKTLYVPHHDMNLLKPYPYTVSNGFIYQVCENLDEETWELYKTKIQ